MPYPITDSNWSVQVDNKPTFFGVLWKYFDEIAKENRWGSNTQVLYAGQYEKRILPRLSSLPLECYKAEDFKRVIAEISCEEGINAPSTVEHYRNLVRSVIEEAVREEGMKDPLWGDSVLKRYDPQTSAGTMILDVLILFLMPFKTPK